MTRKPYKLQTICLLRERKKSGTWRLNLKLTEKNMDTLRKVVFRCLKERCLMKITKNSSHKSIYLLMRNLNVIHLLVSMEERTRKILRILTGRLYPPG